MADVPAIDWRFSAGDRVGVRLPNGSFRLATVIARAACGGIEGYYLEWELPADAPHWVERGGWKAGMHLVMAPPGVDRV